MGKRPTPKKRLSKDRGRRRHAVFVNTEIRRLVGLSASPYASPAKPKDQSGKAIEKITRIKA